MLQLGKGDVYANYNSAHELKVFQWTGSEHIVGVLSFKADSYFVFFPVSGIF